MNLPEAGTVASVTSVKLSPGPTFLCHVIEPQPEVVLVTDHLIHRQLLLPGGELCQVATLGPAVLPPGAQDRWTTPCILVLQKVASEGS